MTITYSSIALKASFGKEVLQFGDEVTDLLVSDPRRARLPRP
jgi:hypothetical protein